MSVKKWKQQHPCLWFAHKNHRLTGLVFFGLLSSEAFILMKSNDLSQTEFVGEVLLDADPVVLN